MTGIFRREEWGERQSHLCGTCGAALWTSWICRLQKKINGCWAMRNSHKNLLKTSLHSFYSNWLLSFYSYFTTAEMTGIIKIKMNTMIQHFTQWGQILNIPPPWQQILSFLTVSYFKRKKKKFKVADGGKKKEKKIKNPVFEGRHTELLMEA